MAETGFIKEKVGNVYMELYGFISNYLLIPMTNMGNI